MDDIRLRRTACYKQTMRLFCGRVQRQTWTHCTNICGDEEDRLEEDSGYSGFTYDRQVGHGRNSFGLSLNLASIIQSHFLHLEHVFLSVHASDHRSARVDLNVILVPGNGDVLVRELQLEKSRIAFLHSLVLYR